MIKEKMKSKELLKEIFEIVEKKDFEVKNLFMTKKSIKLELVLKDKKNIKEIIKRFKK